MGTLAFVTVAPGVLRGYLYPNDDGEALRVRGIVDDKMGIDLSFELTDGRVIVGTGIVEAPIGECRGTIDGTFIGPEKEDTGDWAGVTFDDIIPFPVPDETILWYAPGVSADEVELRADDEFDPFFDAFGPVEFLVVITDPDSDPDEDPDAEFGDGEAIL